MEDRRKLSEEIGKKKWQKKLAENWQIKLAEKTGGKLAEEIL